MRVKLISLYEKLYSEFGSQAWWPAQSAFEVAVGAILTQNTSWNNVEKAIINLKAHQKLTPDKLYRLPKRQLGKLIKSAGFFNIKAERLKDFLKFLFKYYEGDIDKMRGIDTHFLRQQLLSIKGIGNETADSILLYALNKPVFVVDAYTKRILSRHKLIEEKADYAHVQGIFMKYLEPDEKLFNEYHALLVRLAKEFCLKNKPKCDSCPLK